jgi:hypothetical protein
MARRIVGGQQDRSRSAVHRCHRRPRGPGRHHPFRRTARVGDGL